MIFGVSSEGNNDGSGRVNVRAVFGGHAIDFPFSCFLSAIALAVMILKMPAKVENTFFSTIAARSLTFLGKRRQCQKHLLRRRSNLYLERYLMGKIPDCTNVEFTP